MTIENCPCSDLEVGCTGWRNIQKMAAIDWAKNCIYGGDSWVVLDFETTGLEGEALQIGIVDQGGIVRLDSLICPLKLTIDPGTQATHGISAEMVADAPTFAELYERIMACIAGKRVLAYNAKFDRGILERTCGLYNLPVPEAEWDDPMLRYAAYHGEWNSYYHSFRWQRLEQACQQMGITVSGAAHNAAVDCEMTRQLILAMAGEEKNNDD